MKRYLAWLLVLCAVLSGCGKSEPVETVAETAAAVTEAIPEESPEAPTEAPITAPTAEELLRSTDTVTVQYDDFSSYVGKLRELGFREVYDPDVVDASECVELHSLTYNDRAFKLEFTYFGGLNGKEEGWVLYGVRDRDGLDNISEINFADYQYADSFDDSRIPERAEKAMALNTRPLLGETTFCFTERDDHTSIIWTIHTSLYFVHTRNLYNYVRTTTQGEETYNYPAGEFLVGWEDILNYIWDEQKLPFIWTHSQSDSMNIGNIYYEEGMTWKEWCDSKYNVQGWTYVDEGDGWVRTHFDEYVVQVKVDKNGNPHPVGALKVAFHPGVRLNGEPCVLYWENNMMTVDEARTLGFPG